MSQQVCDACTARYAVGAESCPQCGAKEWTLDHVVDQREEKEMAAKITEHGGASYPLNRPGEGAPRRFVDEQTGGEVEDGGREPVDPDGSVEDVDTPVTSDEPAGAGERLERPADNAATALWVAYADQEDPGTDHTELKRAELIELYGG